MIYALIQVLTLAFCLVFHRSIHRHAMWYYLAAIVVTALYFYGDFFGLPDPIWLPLFYLIQQCMWGMAFFVVVMFVGALPRSSKVAQNLRSIRGELSIIAWILCLGHLVYLTVVPPLVRIAFTIGFAMPAAVAGLAVSIVLLVLLAVLGVTSFRTVKKHMTAKAWRAVQWWAYPFYALVYIHLILMLAPSIGQLSATSLVSAGAYTLIFGVYAVMRVRRAVLDKGKAKPPVGQGLREG